MKTREEKRWEYMQKLLLAESSGKGTPRFASQRTLFGIKSHVEDVIDAVAAEDEMRCKEQAKQINEEGESTERKS